eukprot:CAMPEP_0206466658 /NCGR_PEP_ID=MMETSP0324_2-20121206/28587_1 /ASSEMBLY_ACC=CAM_ASM_000836 /TAXON_ID=2866 /ORGANISM="Crypthecodinium cohnii, Strain Seligo" /LENGTH=632 /DNA_ID=CAMNT_0053939811 /DNA_START=69 /DNA_END=1967 /DNA_ORIENTATION=-
MANRSSASSSTVQYGRPGQTISLVSAMRTGGPVRAPPLARRPVAAPKDETDWEEELWRLEKMYAEKGRFECIEREDGSRLVTLVHHCSDPDWEGVNWAPNGLEFEIEVPASYPEISAQESRVFPKLKLTNPVDLPERFKEMVPKLFEESVSKSAAWMPAVYRGLQFVDRHLTVLWLKIRAKERGEDPSAVVPGGSEAAGSTAEAAQDTSGSKTGCWSAAEQERLDAAMAEYRSVTDPKKRWLLVAERVGGGKTARDCAERFRTARACGGRELAKKEIPVAPFQPDPRVSLPAPPPPPSSSSAAASSNAAGGGSGGGGGAGGSSGSQTAPAMSVAEVRRLGAEIRFLGLSLEGFATLLPSALRIEVVCERCKKPHDLESIGSGTEGRGVHVACPTCKQQMGISVAPTICHGGCSSIAHVAGTNCQPVQLLRSDIEAVCGECNAAVLVRNCGPGYRKKGTCAACHAKTNIMIEGADVIGTGVSHWRQVAQAGAEQQNARKQLQDARRREKDMGIKVGNPLPYQGACKHYLKSYKWFRFPCCGRAFPCSDCHDEQMDHPYEWANRMLCGHCSFEQMSTKDKCGNCGAETTRNRTAYWEGGEGCRNRAVMSKNDIHKYKGLGKTVSNRAISKAGAK